MLNNTIEQIKKLVDTIKKWAKVNKDKIINGIVKAFIIVLCCSFLIALAMSCSETPTYDNSWMHKEYDDLNYYERKQADRYFDYLIRDSKRSGATW